MSVRRSALAAFLLAALASPAGAGPTYSTMYVFGDSLSDNGNLFALTGGLPDGPAPDPSYYYQGRFLNGRNYAEILYDRLALPGDLTPAYLNAAGTNYAVGGARSRYHRNDVVNDLPPPVDPPFLPPNPLSLLGQIGLYGSRIKGVSDPDALYVMWLGSNDLFDILAVAANDPINGPTKAIELMDQSLGDIKDSLNFLISTGAQQFLVPSLPDISLTPEVRASDAAHPGLGIAVAAGTLSLLYNEGLDEILQEILGQPGPDPEFDRFDVAGFLHEAVANPGDFGLTNAIDACMVGFFVAPPPDEPSSQCKTPDTYLFWDQIHPSATGHTYLAAGMYDVVPEPLPLTLLGLGLTLLLVRRRVDAHAASQPRQTA
jgi:phospholipase/lecithinase/hemolysin